MGLKKKLVGVTATAVAGSAIVFAPAALAYGPSYCNRSSCDLAAYPSTGGIYAQIPRGTGETMLCWTDTSQHYLGTNRWFKISTVYWVGYTNANEVSNQARAGHC
jgi:hypothetical protein